MKKNDSFKYYAIVILLSTLVITLVYILKNISPFGENSLLTIDFYHQYGPMLGELYRRIYNHSSLIYSFNMGLGLPFFRNYFNYLSSPINIIILLFRYKHLLTSYSFIIGIKAILSALSIAIFFKWKFGENYKLIPLTILYAFSAYFIAYYWNIMWMDGMYMVPIITLGIEKLIKKEKYLLYVISLAVMLYINYFIGYMICIFSVLYFIMYLCLNMKKFDLKYVKKKVLIFFVSSLVAGILCAFFLVPLYLSLRTTSATGDVWPMSQYYDFTLKDFIFSHFSGTTSTVLKSNNICAPNVSCGIMALVLLILFWLNEKIKMKEKLCYGGLLIFFILSFTLAPLDFIWHGMHVPNDLPYRYSFLYSFVLIIMAGYSIINIKKIKFKQILFTYFGCLVGILFFKLLNYEYINDDMIMLNAIVLTLTYICYLVYMKRIKWGKYIFIALSILIVVERILVINNNWDIDQKIALFYEDNTTMNNIIKNINYDEIDKFYRIGKYSTETFNDSSWYGYAGATSFSSMEYRQIAKLMNDLGLSSNKINSFSYKQNTPIIDLMFDIKYLIIPRSVSDYYTSYIKVDDTDVYKNNYTLGLMYGVKENIKKWRVYHNQPFYNQNKFIEKATGIKNTLEKVKDISKETVYRDTENYRIIKYHILNNKYDYYLYFDGESQDIDFIVYEGTLYYTNENYDYYQKYKELNIQKFEEYNEQYIINIFSDKEYIDIYVGCSTNDNVNIYTLNKDRFLEAYNYLIDKKVEITEFRENYIEGKIDVDDDMVIYTSIPYDMGWDVYVDNMKVEKYKIGDSLLGFSIPKGSHTIKLKYHIPFLCLFIIIDIVIIGLYIINKKYKIIGGKK